MRSVDSTATSRTAATHLLAEWTLLVLALLFAAPVSAKPRAVRSSSRRTQRLDNHLAVRRQGAGITMKDARPRRPHHRWAGAGVGISASDHIQIVNGTIAGFGRGVRGRWLARHDASTRRSDETARASIARRHPAPHRGQLLAQLQASQPPQQMAGDPAPMVVRRNAISAPSACSITGEQDSITDNRIERNAVFGVLNDYGHPVRIARNVVAATSDGVTFSATGDDCLDDISRTNRDNGVAATDVPVPRRVHGRDRRGNSHRADLVRRWCFSSRTGGHQPLSSELHQPQTVTMALTFICPSAAHLHGRSTSPSPPNKAFFNGDLGIQAARRNQKMATMDGGRTRRAADGNPRSASGGRAGAERLEASSR